MGTSDTKPFPVIAIAGRPNVGKSTLFNRLIGDRHSITDETAGVTRDPVETMWDFNDHKIKLIDTGGLTLEKGHFDPLVTQKSFETIEKADLIMLLMDVMEETAEDQEFIQRLRKYADKIILVVNKVDHHTRMDGVWNFHQYGFAEVVPVSAAHGLGFEELEDAIASRIDFDAYTYEEEEPTLKLAILGKPNTGKSTLTNYLTGYNRSIVSDVAGTTRDIVEGYFDYKEHRFQVLDTAGIRRKARVTDDVEYYSVNRAIKTVERADVVLLMMDANEGLSEQDKKIAAQIIKHGRGVLFVLNKWDTLEEMENRYEAMVDRIRFLFPVLDFAPVVHISALTGKNVHKLLDRVIQVYNQLQFRVDTSLLNDKLAKWKEENPPPNGRKPFRVKYITQVSSHPVKFVMFVNKVKSFPDFYTRYISNKIRKDFGLSIIPIGLEIRERH